MLPADISYENYAPVEIGRWGRGHAIGYLIALVKLGTQYFLSRKSNVYWGAFLPVMYIAFIVYGKLSGLFTEDKDKDIIMILAGGTLLLLSVWANGRDKRKKELQKIELHDL